MTDADMNDRNADDAQRARVEALRQRRAPRVERVGVAGCRGRPGTAPDATSPCRRSVTRGRGGVQRGDDARPRRRHGSRPTGELGDSDRAGRHDHPARAGADIHTGAGGDAAAPGPATAAPPVALTARPQRPGDDPHHGRPGGAHQWQSLSPASG